MANIDVAGEARVRGAARLFTWTMDGTLVSLSAAAQGWRMGINVIASAAQRGAIFEVWVANLPYVPATLVDLGLEQSAEICRAMDGQSASSKLAFLRVGFLLKTNRPRPSKVDFGPLEASGLLYLCPRGLMLNTAAFHKLIQPGK